MRLRPLERPPLAAARPVAGQVAWEWFLAHRDVVLGFLLVAATLLAYQPAWQGKPVWDDNAHIIRPELRSMDGLVRIWSKLGDTQQYYPFLYSVFWVEQKLWGDAPLGYHLVNILLHAVSALLVVKLLRRLEIPGAWLAAGIFALHPVNVESVAWISELKNTLSGLFYFTAALAYLRFAGEPFASASAPLEGASAAETLTPATGCAPAVTPTRRWGFYALSLGLFVLGLLTKSVIATLPAALLLVFWWQRGNLSWRRDVAPLAPFFLAGLVAGLFTAWFEKNFVGAQGEEFQHSLLERGLIAGRVIWFYLGKLFWPADLMFNYPRWEVSQAVWWQYLFPTAALLLLGWLWSRSPRNRAPLTALLFFVGTLFPVLGFLNIFPFRYSYVADHFQYLPSLGIFALASAGAVRRFQKYWLNGPASARAQPAGLALGLALLALLALLTWRQSRIYCDAETLYRATLTRNPGSFLAHDELANVLLAQGRKEEALVHYAKFLEAKPNYPAFQLSLANDLIARNRVEEAIPHYEKYLDLQPDHPDVQYTLGNILLRRGRVDDAIARYELALQFRPEDADAHSNLGSALVQKGRIDEAVAHFDAALKIRPDFAEVQNNLGYVAWLLATSPNATVRNGNKAVALGQRAERLSGGKNPMILRALAAAYAEAGQLAEARAVAQRGLSLARAQTNAPLVQSLEQQLERYQSARPAP